MVLNRAVCRLTTITLDFEGLNLEGGFVFSQWTLGSLSYCKVHKDTVRNCRKMRFLIASEWGRFGQWGVVLFRCGAVWTRVEAAASRAARARDAPAASWRCRPTPCSAPDLDPWTTATGFAFRPATARPHTASTTRSSRKVKVCVYVCVFLSTATYRWHLTVLRRHSHVLSSGVPRRHWCVDNSWIWNTVQPSFYVAVVNITDFFFTWSGEHNNVSYWDSVSPVLHLLLWSQPFHFEIYFSHTLSKPYSLRVFRP